MKERFYLILVIFLALRIVENILQQFGAATDSSDGSGTVMVFLGYFVLFATNGLMAIHFFRRAEWFIFVALILSTVVDVTRLLHYQEFMRVIQTSGDLGLALNRIELNWKLSVCVDLVMGLAFILADRQKWSWFALFGMSIICLDVINLFVHSLDARLEAVSHLFAVGWILLPLPLFIYFWKEMQKQQQNPQ